MKSLYEVFGTEKNYETEGVVLDFGVAKFKVRRAGGQNREYATALSARLRPLRRQFDAGVISEETSRDILLDVYFEKVMVSWEGVTDREGNVLALNRENFKRLMTDLPDLWLTLQREADSIKNFQVEDAKEDAEKLGKS